MRLLLIEDEQSLRDQLASQLRRQGFVVEEAGDGRCGLYLGQEYPIDLAIVDLGLPDVGGMEVIRRWREGGCSFPVLVLTARGAWQDKVEGREAGADDYLVKPFHQQELLARVNALLRRAAGWPEPVIRCAPLCLDTRSQQVTVDGRPVCLTAYEYRVLEHLMLHAGEVVSKRDLSEHLYSDDDERDSNVLEVLVARLRRKLDPDGSLQPIETLRGRGYRLRLPRE